RPGGRPGHAGAGPALLLGAARVDRAVPQLGEHLDRVVGVAAADDHVADDVALDHAQERLGADAGGNVGRRDAAALVAGDASGRALDEAHDERPPALGHALAAVRMARGQEEDVLVAVDHGDNPGEAGTQLAARV